MKIILVILFSLFLAPVAHAQNITTGNKSVEVRIENRINTKEEVKQEIRVRVTAVKRERIRSHFGKMIVRIEALIERLQKLIDRLETKNVDVATANAVLSQANTELANLKLKLDQMLDSDDPKLVFSQIQESVKLIKDSLKETHRLLVQTIGEIKNEK